MKLFTFGDGSTEKYTDEMLVGLLYYLRDFIVSHKNSRLSDLVNWDGSKPISVITLNEAIERVFEQLTVVGLPDDFDLPNRYRLIIIDMFTRQLISKIE